MAQSWFEPAKTRQRLTGRAVPGLVALGGLLLIGAIVSTVRIWPAGSRDRTSPPPTTQTAGSQVTVAASSGRAPALFSDDYVASLMSIPEFAAQAGPLTAPERRDLAMALASRGVRRLDDGALSDRATRLGPVLDRLDDSLCFNVAVGIPLRSDQWMRVLEAMDQSDSLGACAEYWGSAYRAAIVAELKMQPQRTRDPLASARAIAALRRACTEDEREFFLRSAQGGGSMADFAAGLRLTYRKVPELSRADRAAVLRLLVSS
jgi:hypothetical protein